MSIQAIQDELLGLPVQERMRMIDVLWGSLIEDRTKARENAWAQEGERRIDAFETGKLAARDTAQVLAELRNTLGE